MDWSAFWYGELWAFFEHPLINDAVQLMVAFGGFYLGMLAQRRLQAKSDRALMALIERHEREKLALLRAWLERD